jgi:sugar-specific transcriptional regulator TrmB
MSQLTSTLQSFGLSHTEAVVYECGLKEGDTDVAHISRLLGLNRATVYHAIHELERRGLLLKRTENGKLMISMLREEGIKAYFNFEEAKLRERKDALERLFERMPKAKGKGGMPEIEYFTGFTGVKMALEIALRAKGRKWDILAPKHNFFSEADEDFAAYYLAERRKRRIVSRSLWEKTKDVVHVSEEVMRERNPRYLPRRYNGSFTSVMILFDERALFISSTKEMQAILINSSDIASTLRMQFDALWSSSVVA